MYKRLKAEMMVNDITNEDLAELLGENVENIDNKINGQSDFSLNEVVLIMDTYFPTESTDYLFR